MYIKLKHIKIFFLISACFLFAGVNYFSYVNADDNLQTSAMPQNNTLTNSFTQSLGDFIKSKGNEPISATDIQTFADSQVANIMGEPVTFDTLPQVDTAKIKILKQSYSNLSTTDKKTKEKEDLNEYLKDILYLLANNAPQSILTENDAENFYQDFLLRLSDPGSNIDYFSDLGDRLELFSNQMNNIEVPETAVDLHIKFLRLIQGILSLRTMPAIDIANDPIQSQVTLLKAKGYADLFDDFFNNDVRNYFNQIHNNS